MSTTKRILFVDQVSPDLRKFKSVLHNEGFHWDLSYASSAELALQQLELSPVDLIVTDLRLPGMTGDRLLFAAKAQFPQILRVVLADLHDRRTLLSVLGTVHQFLLKPCDPHRLVQALQRSFSFSVWLPDAEVCQLMGEMIRLPSPPSLYFQVVRELESPDASLMEVGKKIARDPGMTARLLQFVNSAIFGLSREIVHPGEAVTFLGSAATQALLILAHGLSAINGVQLPPGAVESIWKHALIVSRFAREVATRETTDPYVIEASATAGLLHDIGKLVLAANRPVEYVALQREAATEPGTAWSREKDRLGASHAEIGGCLLAIWGLPAATVEAAALHHTPAQFLHLGFCPLTAVHIANALTHGLDTGKTNDWLDRDYLARLGLSDRLPVWQEACDLARQWER